jgi:hypothetical protein
MPASEDGRRGWPSGAAMTAPRVGQITARVPRGALAGDQQVPLGTPADPLAQPFWPTGPPIACGRCGRAKDVWISNQVDPDGANNLPAWPRFPWPMATAGLAPGQRHLCPEDGGRSWQDYSGGITSEAYQHRRRR